LTSYLFNAVLDDKHFKKMVDYMNAKDVFNGRSIAGGVSYFLYDKQYEGDTDFTTVNNKSYNNQRKLDANDIIPRHYIGDTVISKVKQKATDYMAGYVYKNDWGLDTDYEGNFIRTSSEEVEVITPRGISYAEFDDRPKYCDTYKVAFTRVVSGRAVEPDSTFKYSILSSLQILKPGQICNASYMVVNRLRKEEYANNIKAYFETKFVRFLILQTLFGIGLTPDRFKYVPVMDFTKLWTDEKLYEYFGLDDTEIEFIENIIKPLSNPEKTKITEQAILANYVNTQIKNLANQ